MRRGARLFPGMDIDAIHARMNAAARPAIIGGLVSTTAQKAAARPTLPDKPPSPYEHDEQAKLFYWWDRFAPTKQIDPLLMYAIPNAQKMNSMAKDPRSMIAYLKKEGMRPGVLDVNLDYPTREYAGLRIEMKRMDGKPSDVSANQSAYVARFRKAGYRSEVMYGADAAIKLIQEYLK